MKLSNIVLIICIVLGVAFLTGLGVWQLKRLAWKEALVERVHANMKNEPLSVDQVEAMITAGEDIEYRPATVSGHFVHDAEAHFFITHKGKPGYFVFTPLVQTNGDVIMINRGFVPMGRKDVSSRAEGQVKGQVSIVGLARSAPLEKPNRFVPDNNLEKNVFYWKSLAQMKRLGADKAGDKVNAFFIDANDTPVSGGLPVGGVTLIQFPNSHLQYALTWFGLAGALLVVGGFFLRSRTHHKIEHSFWQ